MNNWTNRFKQAVLSFLTVTMAITGSNTIGGAGLATAGMIACLEGERDARDAWENNLVPGRMGRPEEIANAVVFLFQQVSPLPDATAVGVGEDHIMPRFVLA